MSIQPLFVFDGPHKPPFKRNKRTAPYTYSTPDFLVKNMLKLFGVPYIVAPGEAEAECALLQKEGLVDAVLSEDVDTLMFGSTKLLRNWNGDASRQGTAPTHVDMYDAGRIKAESSMDRDGIVLAALMSGADYMPEGVTGFGIKIACEAARAGFGRDLLAIPQGDKHALKDWRERLQHELQTNESGFFRTRHKALKVPESFPSGEVLYYYRHPLVSGVEQVEKYRRDIQWPPKIDVQGLRAFVAEAFEWRFKAGAIHFIRGLAPISLALRLAFREGAHSSGEEATLPQPGDLVKGITKQRTHVSTDLMSELRISYVPCETVPLDLASESETAPSHTALYQSEMDENCPGLEPRDDAETGQPESSPTKKKDSSATAFDPTKVQKEWVWEVLVRRSLPRTFAEWEVSQQKLKEPKVRKARGAAGKASHANQEAPNVGLDRFFKITKSTMDNTVHAPGSPGEVRMKGQSEVEAEPNQSRTPQRRRRGERRRLTPRKGIDLNPWSLSQKGPNPNSNAVVCSEPLEQKYQAGYAEDDPFIIPSSPAAAEPQSPLVTNVSMPIPPAVIDSRPANQGLELEEDALYATASRSLTQASGNRDETELARVALKSDARNGSKVSKTQSNPSLIERDTSQPRPLGSKNLGSLADSPRFDFGVRTPTKQPLLPWSSPSLPSPTLIFASTASSESQPLRASLQGANAPSRRARQRSDARLIMHDGSWEDADGYSSNVGKLCAHVEVFDLTGD